MGTWEDASYKQLLTIRHQLYKGLHGESPDEGDDWTYTSHDREDLSDDVRADTVQEIQDLAHQWMVGGRDPQDLVQRFGKGANTTLKFLRENVQAWEEHEAWVREEGLRRRIFKFYGWPLDKRSASWAVEEQGRTVRQYIRDLEAYLKRERVLIKELYPVPTEEEGDYWPRKWMLTKKIRAAMGSKQGKRRIALLNALWRRRETIVDSLYLLGQIRQRDSATRAWLASLKVNGKWEKQPVLVQPDGTLPGMFGVTEPTLWRDLVQLAKVGALRKLGKPGKNERAVYVIGLARTFYTEERRIRRIVPLLTESKTAKQRLAEYLG